MRPAIYSSIISLILGFPIGQYAYEAVVADYPMEGFVHDVQTQGGSWEGENVVVVRSSSLFTFVDDLDEIAPVFPIIGEVRNAAATYSEHTVDSFGELSAVIEGSEEASVFVIIAHGRNDSFTLGKSERLTEEAISNLPALRDGAQLVLISCSVGSMISESLGSDRLLWTQLADQISPEGTAYTSSQVIFADVNWQQVRIANLKNSPLNETVRSVMSSFGQFTYFSSGLGYLRLGMMNQELIAPRFNGEGLHLRVYDQAEKVIRSIPME